jgi:hypothetical protein
MSLIRNDSATAIPFRPKPRNNLRPIFENTISAELSVREAVYELEDTFCGKSTSTCYQTSWMGRGCFLQIPLSSRKRHLYISAKGVGPGPGSELMRQRLDAIFRRRNNSYGGCLRLETNTYYPLLVCFRLRNDRWVISHPRPEGFSSFRNLIREFIVSALIEQTDIPILSPLLLLRDHVSAPWGPETQESLEEYILDRISLAIFEQLKAKKKINRTVVSFPVNPHVSGVSYLNLDGGVLIRSARSPYRVANLHAAATNEDIKCIRSLREHFIAVNATNSGDVFSDLNESIYNYARSMAQTAANLFSEGIIHGQLHLHYQNISLAGEIADLDCAIFAMPILIELGKVDFPVCISRVDYDIFWEKIIYCSKHLKTDILPIFKADYEEIGGIDPRVCDKDLLAASMLRQIYDIYNHTMRTIDLVYRSDLRRLNQPGTILTDQEWDYWSFVFQNCFSSHILLRKSQLLFNWCLEDGYECLKGVILKYVGRQTIYGWAYSDVALDYTVSVCDESQQKYIYAQVDQLLRVVSNRQKS